MKKLLYIIAILILIPSWGFALTGYTNHKNIVLTGSTAGQAAAGYVIPISVSPDADPVESGKWTVNSTVYKYRVPISVVEVTGGALTNYPCLVEINTKALYQRGFISATQTGDEFEFNDGTTNYAYYVVKTDSNPVKSGFRQYRTRYYVKLSLTANQTKTIYFYFSNTVTAASSHAKTMAQMFATYSYDSRTTANLAKWYDGSYLYDGNTLEVGYLYYAPMASKTPEESGFHFTGLNLNSNYYGDQVIGWGSATLTVTSQSGLGLDQGTNLSTQIEAESSDNAAIFSTTADYQSRVKSLTAVAWNITSAWTDGVEYTSPNIISVIQSVINRSGFTSGNSINLYWQKTSSCALGQETVIYPYNADPTKAARLQFTVYLHPDYKKLPKVTMPQLVVADVFLDGNSSFFPYDVAFTANDGTTQLYQSDMPERLISDTNVVTWGVKTSAAIPQSKNLTINVWYTNSSQTTKHTYWSAANTFTYFNDFESGITDFTTVSGTWSQGTQQRPLIKGGRNGWDRCGIIFKTGSTYKALTTPSWKWSDFGMITPWELPTSQGTLHTASIINDYWYTSGYPVYEDRSQPVTTGNMYWSYPSSVATNDNGVTYYRTDANPNGTITLSKSLNNGETWTLVQKIWTIGDQSTPSTGGISAFLYWETDTWYLYIGYVGILNPPLYVAARVNASPAGTFTIAGSSGTPYNLHPASYGTYQEEVKVVKNGSTYYTFGGDATSCPSPYQSTLCQRIVYASANTPLGDSVTHTFTNLTEITLPYYDGNYAGQGVPYPFKDGSDWYMAYYGQPQSDTNISNYSDIDNFLYLAKATSFPSVWQPQKLIKTLQSGSSQSGNTIVKNSTSYSNVVINTNIELPYGSNMGGVVFRYQDSSNYYYAFLNKTYNTVGLYKVVAGIWTLMNYTQLKFTINASGTFYPMRIGLYGDQIVVQASQYGSYWDTYINVYDASLATSGQVGFKGSSQVYVDDIAISPYLYPEVSISKSYTPTQ